MWWPTINAVYWGYLLAAVLAILAGAIRAEWFSAPGERQANWGAIEALFVIYLIAAIIIAIVAFIVPQLPA